MTSSRLPGKVLADLGGQPILAWVLKRARRACMLDAVVVATTANRTDDPVATLSASLGAATIRGDEEDVLSRFVIAARESGATCVVRITADCPFVDPTIVDDCIRRFHESSSDYVSNGLVATFPRGLDVEVFSTPILEVAHRESTQSYERAHVTPFIYERPQRFRLLSVESGEALGHERWTVDTPEDLAFVRAVAERMSGRDDFHWREVVDLVGREPALRELNRSVRQKALEEG